ncbi:MAG: MerR family transcriptional regulator, partial [Candidatus Aminicenantes bacterium]
MTKNFLIRKEFIEKAKISEKVLKEWETAKIVKPARFTEDNLPFYTPQTVARVNNIRKLLDMGYDVEDIQKILKKVGPPKSSGGAEKSNELKKHLTIGGLA